jgi:hypothetical protein
MERQEAEGPLQIKSFKNTPQYSQLRLKFVIIYYDQIIMAYGNILN